MNFKVGDKVKLARTDSEWNWYKNYLGKIFTIKEIGKDWSNEEFAELEENDELMPFIKNLDLVKPEYTYEDLKKAPIGTKITFENGEVLIKDSEIFFQNTRFSIRITELKSLKDKYANALGKIIKIEEPKYTTVYESEPEILDNTEKRYLKDVIRPFRDRVSSIYKIKSYINNNKEYIFIKIGNESINLPYFEENTMYKDMRLEKEYTLEELGI